MKALEKALKYNTSISFMRFPFRMNTINSVHRRNASFVERKRFMKRTFVGHRMGTEFFDIDVLVEYNYHQRKKKKRERNCDDINTTKKRRIKFE